MGVDMLTLRWWWLLLNPMLCTIVEPSASDDDGMEPSMAAMTEVTRRRGSQIQIIACCLMRSRIPRINHAEELRRILQDSRPRL